MDEELKPDAVPDPDPDTDPVPETETEPEAKLEFVVEKKHAPIKRTKTRTKACVPMNETRNNKTSCFHDEHEDDRDVREFEYYLNPLGLIHEWPHIYMLLITFLCYIYNYSMDCLFESESYMNTA